MVVVAAQLRPRVGIPFRELVPCMRSHFRVRRDGVLELFGLGFCIPSPKSQTQSTQRHPKPSKTLNSNLKLKDLNWP